MTQDVETLLKLGVARKREGDFQEAQRLCLEAISLDPSHVISYYNLAKVCYLAGERNKSVVNYLRTLHLSLLNQWRTTLKNGRDAMPAQLDPEFEQFLRKQHDAAVFLPFQQNTTTHLGHALIDLDASAFKQTHDVLFQDSASPETLAFLKNHVGQYRTSLSGGMTQLDDALEDNTYSRVGLFFAIRELSWDSMVEAKDVCNIYPDSMLIPNPFVSSGNEPPPNPSSRFRSSPTVLTNEQAKECIEKQGFFHAFLNPGGGYHNEFYHYNDEIVVDAATGIMWLLGGSEFITVGDAERWIDFINRLRFSDFADWRLPTLEEAASLLQDECDREEAQYINPLFSDEQLYIVTCDTTPTGDRFNVDFNFGNFHANDNSYPAWIRPCRTVISSNRSKRQE